MGSGQKPRTQEQIMQQTAEYAARKIEQKRRKARSPASTELNCSAPTSEVIEIVQRAYTLFDRPHCTTDEQVCEALNWYFQEYLPKSGAFPTIEGLSLACGVNRRTFEAWARGEFQSSDARQVIAQKAIGVLAELDAQLVQSGKIPQVVYIFRSKNFYGMQDAVKVEHISMRQEQESPDTLAARYADAIPVDFTESDSAESH